MIELAWSIDRLGEGLHALAEATQLLDPARRERAIAVTVPLTLEGAELGRWIAWCAGAIGLEAEALETTLPEATGMLRRLGPAVVRLEHEGRAGFLLVLGCRRRVVRILAPDLSTRSIPVATLRDTLCAPLEAPLRQEVDRLLAPLDLRASARKKVGATMRRVKLAHQRVGGVWMLRLPAGAPFGRQLRDVLLPSRVALLAMVFIALYAMEIAGWTLIGRAALAGRHDPGWLLGWGLMVFSLVPLQLLAGWLDANVALDFGSLLKKRLLTGALHMDLQSVKARGAGQLLGQVLESQALESLALNGGFTALVAGIELFMAFWVLALGAAGAIHVTMLCIWLGVIGALCFRYYRRLLGWTLKRLDLTHDLIERMVGHRTVLAQEPRFGRESKEDRLMADYLGDAIRVDRLAAWIVGGIPRGWLILAVAGLVPAFLAHDGFSAALAISLGGILLANRACTGFAGGFLALARAAVAWRQVNVLFTRAATTEATSIFLTRDQMETESQPGTPLISASDIVFRYDSTAEPVLNRLSLDVHRGDRILLEGRSGGGKSTLAGVLTGLNQPESGLVLLKSLDRFTLGANWHQMVTAAGQFHENHILGGTLAFNLLMGREWPPSEKDLEDAALLCRELGLGDLLDRMPSGLQQVIGETGWQLSHGERSRVFLACALLQNSQLTVLDEFCGPILCASRSACSVCSRVRGRWW
ncbi:MAG: ABC transporter ATP-binding protein [Pseudomonadales bacterium]